MEVVDIFLSCIAKEKLSDLRLYHGILNKRWVGIPKIAAAEELSSAIWRRFEKCKKYLCLGCVDVNES
jgi:hypothetical protein